MLSLNTYLFVAAITFCLGLYGAISRRDEIGIFMSIELILISANINFVAFSRFTTLSLDGHVFALFVIVIAVAEMVIGIGILINGYKNFRTTDLERLEKPGDQ